MAQVKYFYGHYAWKRNSYLITMVVYRIAGRIPVRFVPVLLFRDICLNGSKQQCQSQRLTVHLKVNGKTSFPLSGSASVKESRPSTTLEVFPKEHDPVLVTLLWYSFRHNLKNVLHGVEQRPVTGERAPPPQHSSLDSSPRGFTISKTCSSKKPEPWAHCNKRKMSDDNKKQKAHLWLLLYVLWYRWIERKKQWKWYSSVPSFIDKIGIINQSRSRSFTLVCCRLLWSKNKSIVLSYSYLTGRGQQIRISKANSGFVQGQAYRKHLVQVQFFFI